MHGKTFLKTSLCHNFAQSNDVQTLDNGPTACRLSKLLPYQLQIFKRNDGKVVFKDDDKRFTDCSVR